jgi:hypothetical protein
MISLHGNRAGGKPTTLPHPAHPSFVEQGWPPIGGDVGDRSGGEARPTSGVAPYLTNIGTRQISLAPELSDIWRHNYERTQQPNEDATGVVTTTAPM